MENKYYKCNSTNYDKNICLNSAWNTCSTFELCTESIGTHCEFFTVLAGQGSI